MIIIMIIIQWRVQGRAGGGGGGGGGGGPPPPPPPPTTTPPLFLDQTEAQKAEKI